MKQRCKMANVVNSWHQLKSCVKDLFTDNPKNRSTYNSFVSMNLDDARVFITKRMSDENASVLDNFYISSGKIEPSIKYEIREQYICSDIALGDFVFEENTSVGDFSLEILRYNKRFTAGDILILIAGSQQFNQNFEIPYFGCGRGEIELNIANRILLNNYFREGFLMNVDGYLAVKYDENQYIAWVQKRILRDETVMVSTQTLCGCSPTLQQYTSNEALLDSIESYGKISASDATKLISADYDRIQHMGDLNKVFDKAFKSLIQGELDQAFELFKSAAEQGHAKSQVFLGTMYKNGQGVEKDEQQGDKWLRKAVFGLMLNSKHDDKESQYMLGNMYHDGKGVAQDYLKAAEYYQKAAKLHHPWAQYMLGQMYQNDEGFSSNSSMAAYWYKLAAEGGNEQAKQQLTQLDHHTQQE